MYGEVLIFRYINNINIILVRNFNIFVLVVIWIFIIGWVIKWMIIGSFWDKFENWNEFVWVFI